MSDGQRSKLQAELNEVASLIRDAESQIKQHEMWIENLEQFAAQKRKRRDEIMAMKESKP